MMNADDLIDKLRIEFKRADTSGEKQLNMNQLNQVFKNMNIKLTPIELAAVFKEIDVDRSGTIDIDELYSFISSENTGMGGIAMQAVMNVT